MDNQQVSSSEPLVRTRQRWGWYLYDFSESILIYNGLLYFPKWIVVDSGASELSYNSVFVIVTALLLISAPALGILSDVRYGRLVFLRLINGAMFSSVVVIYLSGRLLQPGTARIVVALAAFGFLLYAHQLTGTFYTPLLARVAAPHAYTKVSATGIAFRRAGAIFGILAILPFATGKLPSFAKGPTEPFLLAALLYGLLMSTSLCLIPDDLPESPVSRPRLGTIYASLIRDLAKVRADRQLLLFLLAYVLFMDAILTVENNMTLYMDRVMHFGDDLRAYFLLSLLVMSAMGAKASAALSVRWGLKPALSVTLGGWTVILAAISVTRGRVVFSALFALAGLLHGAVMNYSRVIYLLLIPKDRRAEYLGLYSSFERFASLSGPLAWGACVSLLGAPAGYRVALLVMASIIAASIPFTRMVELPEQKRES